MDRGNPAWNDGIWDINVGVIYFFKGCKGKKNIYENCKKLNDGVDIDMLNQMYK
ncbi:MAG: hypothetical protein ACI9YU_001909 [Flavobacteriales bacterium]